MGREIENIRTCDVVVIAGGRSGTLGEFAIAYDEAKVIGVLANSGGIVDHIEEITRLVDKDTGAVVISDPARSSFWTFSKKHMKSECFRVTWS